MMQRFARDAFLYALPSFIARIVGLLLLPIYARHLGPADLGFIEYVSAFSTFALLLIPLEISQAMGRLLPESDELKRQRSIIYSTMSFTSWSFIAASIVFFMFKTEIFRIAGIPVIYVGYTPYILCYLFSLSLVSAMQTQFRFLQNVSAAISINIFIIMLNLIIVIISSFDGLNLTDYFLSLCISNFLGVVIGFYYLIRKFGIPIILPEIKITAEMLKYSLPIVVSSFGVAVSLGLDRVLIGRYVGLAELGYYGVAARFGAIAAIAFYTVSSTITPIVYRAPMEPGVKKLIARLFYITISLCLLAMFLLSIFSEWMVVLIAGESFRQSAPLVFYIFTATCISNLYIFFLGMDISKNTTRIGQINLTMGLSSAILSIILIPLIGIWGAIISGLVAASIRLALYIYHSQKAYKINVRLFIPFSAIFVMIIYNSIQLLRSAVD